MEVGLVPLLIVLGLLLCTLFACLICAGRGPCSTIKPWDFIPFYIFIPIVTVWLLLFTCSPVEYETKTFESVTIANCDGFFNKRNSFYNLNREFGQRVESGTIVELKTEIPRYGLVWNSRTEFSLREKDVESSTND